MLLKKRRVAPPPAAPPSPQPVFLVEDEDEERTAFSPLRFPVAEDGTYEPGYLPPMLSYQNLVKRIKSPRDPSAQSSPAVKGEEAANATTNALANAGAQSAPVEAKRQRSEPPVSVPPAETLEVSASQVAQQVPVVTPSAPMRFGKGTDKMSELLCLAELNASGTEGGPNWRSRVRCPLKTLELQDFKSFKRRHFELEKSLSCFIGCNSSGKSAVLDALRFVLARRCDRNLRSYIRRGKPFSSAARVTAHFGYEADEGARGTVLLSREVRLHPDRSQKDAYVLSHWVQEGDEMKEVSQEAYLAWLHALQWAGGDLLLPQFGLMDGRSATGLLAMLPQEIEKVGSEGNASGSLLKRRCSKGAARSGAAGARAEAWLTRRIDEVYRELTREPKDDTFEEWGEGGEAKLRRLPDGSFDLLTSQRRGGASSGCGTSLNSLSDGARDICALCMLFVLPGFISGMQDALAPFMVLDEPDSRLDKRHASALRRFLQRPDGPKQCLWLSLNNHQALPADIVLDGDEGDPGVLEDLEMHQATTKTHGGKDAIKARFLSQMSARLREETEAELDEDM